MSSIFDKKSLFILLPILLVLAGCGEETVTKKASAKWQKTNPESLNSDLKKLYKRSEIARQELAKTLFGKLSQVMSEQGPKAAIEVCNVEAQGMTSMVGEKLNVHIGRTSYRLRNLKNKPPEWARKFDLVKNRVDKQVVLEKENKVAVFTPIRLAEKCTACHGPKEKISEDVKKELAERYPNDRATGFHPGDLRGWFWVEAPAQDS